MKLSFKNTLLYGKQPKLNWSEEGLSFDIDLTEHTYHPQFEDEYYKTFENVKKGSIIYDIGGNIFLAKKLAKRGCDIIVKAKE